MSAYALNTRQVGTWRHPDSAAVSRRCPIRAGSPPHLRISLASRRAALTDLAQALSHFRSRATAYASSLQRTASPCFHHAPACRMAMSTLRSSERDLNRKTFSDACCKPSDSDTSARNLSRSLRLSDRQWACTRAKSRINSGLGSGNSGGGLDSGTAQRGRQSLNATCTRVVTAAVIPNHWNYSHPYVGQAT